MPVITISRQYGSRGEAIALQLCQTLQYRYFDKELMAQAAAEVGLTAGEIVDFSEDNYRVHSFFDNLLIGRSSPEAIIQSEAWQRYVVGRQTPTGPVLDEAQSISLVRQAIHTAYQKGNIVIIGRGGQAILQDRPQVIHVRIEAPLELRVERVRERMKISQEIAKKRVTEHDRAAAGYLKRFYNIDVSNPLLYHLIINTGKLEVDTVIELLTTLIRSISADPSP